MASRALAACSLFALFACKRPPKPTGWREEPVEPNKDFLIEIDGTSDTDIWALSNDAVYHYGGASWDKGHRLALRKLSVAGPGDVWFGGYMGTVVHYDGRNYETYPIDVAKKKYWDVVTIAAWPGDVWVAFGQPGYFEKKGQDDWVYVDPPEFAGWKIHALWGKAKGDVWAGIDRPGAAKVAHLQNGKWTIFDRPQGFGFAGSATNDVWFSGRTMVHWDGATLSDFPMPETDEAATPMNLRLVILLGMVLLPAALYMWTRRRGPSMTPEAARAGWEAARAGAPLTKELRSAVASYRVQNGYETQGIVEAVLDPEHYRVRLADGTVVRATRWKGLWMQGIVPAPGSRVALYAVRGDDHALIVKRL